MIIFKSPRSNHGFTSHYGFTLMEVLIALMITVAAGILVTTSWSGNFTRLQKATRYNNVALLLERKMVEMEAKYAHKKIDQVNNEEGDFGDDMPDYRWTFTAQPFEMPDYGPILASQQDGADENLLRVLSKMREVANKSILEATVTVFIKTPKKEVSFSLTTYFIDFDSELELTL